MMKQPIAIALALLICLSAGRDLLVIAVFSIHREAITLRSCVNLNRPEKHCNGECALKARLEKQQDAKRTPMAPVPKPDTNQVYTCAFPEQPDQNDHRVNHDHRPNTGLILQSQFFPRDPTPPPQHWI